MIDDGLVIPGEIMPDRPNALVLDEYVLACQIIASRFVVERC